MAAVWEWSLKQRLTSQQWQTPESGEQQEGSEKSTKTSRFFHIQEA
jgi:hypothetical protein